MEHRTALEDNEELTSRLDSLEHAFLSDPDGTADAFGFGDENESRADARTSGVAVKPRDCAPPPSSGCTAARARARAERNPSHPRPERRGRKWTKSRERAGRGIQRALYIDNIRAPWQIENEGDASRVVVPRARDLFAFAARPTAPRQPRHRRAIVLARRTRSAMAMSMRSSSSPSRTPTLVAASAMATSTSCGRTAPARRAIHFQPQRRVGVLLLRRS